MPHKNTLSSYIQSQKEDAQPSKQAVQSQIAAKKQKSQSLKARVEQPKTPDTPTIEGDPLSIEDTTALGETISDIKTRLGVVVDRLTLKETVDEMTHQADRLPHYQETLQGLRKKGYPFYNNLEGDIAGIAEAWDALDDEVDAFFEAGDEQLEQDVAQLHDYLKQLGVAKPNSGHQKLAQKLSQSLDDVESRLDNVEDTMRDSLSPIQKQSYAVSNQINRIKSYLELASEASFDLSNDEQIVMAAKGEWQDGDKPDGVVYITTQRIIFEQKEKTGKRLGMFGGKDTQQVLWEVPHSGIGGIQAEDKGLMGGKDYMIVQSSQGDYKVEIKGGYDSKDWCSGVDAVLSGDV